MSEHRCCAPDVKRMCHTQLYFHEGRRYCWIHLPPGVLSRRMRARCSHAMFDPALMAECPWCGADSTHQPEGEPMTTDPSEGG